MRGGFGCRSRLPRMRALVSSIPIVMRTFIGPALGPRGMDSGDALWPAMASALGMIGVAALTLARGACQAMKRAVRLARKRVGNPCCRVISRRDVSTTVLI